MRALSREDAHHMRPAPRIGNVMPEQDLVGGIARMGELADEEGPIILIDFSDEAVCPEEYRRGHAELIQRSRRLRWFAWALAVVVVALLARRGARTTG